MRLFMKDHSLFSSVFICFFSDIVAAVSLFLIVFGAAGCDSSECTFQMKLQPNSSYSMLLIKCNGESVF